MVPLRVKERAHSVIKMVCRYLRPFKRQPRRFGVRAHPWIMRCRIKPKLLNRFADFAFHGGHLIVLLGRNTYASKELCSSGFFCLNPHFLIKIDCCERRRRTSIYYLIKAQEIHAVFWLLLICAQPAAKSICPPSSRISTCTEDAIAWRANSSRVSKQ
jgi:hypothetical protein